MKKLLPIFAIAALIALSGYVHGVWTNRWSKSQALSLALEKLNGFVPEVGEWQSNAVDMNVREQDRAGIDGYVMRRFRNPRNGHGADVLLACGRSGPIAVHTPEICYAGAGYVMTDSPRRITLPGGGESAELFTAKFSKGRTGEGAPLRVYWCRRGKGGWETPDNPRLHFAGLPYLYKLYVIQELTSSDESIDDQLAREFLNQLVPALNAGLALQ